MSLKMLVNDREVYTSFLEEIEDRITRHQKDMERHDDLNSFKKTQGQIEALRSLLQLRETVLDRDKKEQ